MNVPRSPAKVLILYMNHNGTYREMRCYSRLAMMGKKIQGKMFPLTISMTRLYAGIYTLYKSLFIFLEESFQRNPSTVLP